MAELVFKSPGVFTREIDLSGPTPSSPVGVPAGIIGTSDQGPAFVPITISNFSNFSARFGPSDGKKFGPLAVNEWLKNAQACTFIRVLGAGNGKKRDSTDGYVTNAGFTVGEKLVQAGGSVLRNPYAVDLGPSGRTYFLGCFMSESAGSTLFSGAGIQPSPSHVTSSVPIVRGVILAPSGVMLTMSGAISGTSAAPSNTAVAGASLNGSTTGSVKITTSEFTMLLNGHKATSSSPNVITASFDPLAGNYFANVFNTDPLEIEKKGHLLYSRYDIHPALAAVTGTGIFKPGVWTGNTAGGDTTTYEDIGFLLSGSQTRDTGTALYPNYEQFKDRFATPKSPWVISQDFGGRKRNLFRVISLSDGQYANNVHKISIENLTPGKDSSTHGTFDLVVRNFNDTDEEMQVVERFRGLTLDPTSDRYVARAIGDQNTYFDFDNAPDAQKIVTVGDHPVVSSYIRVEQSNDLQNGEVPIEGLPVGYRGPSHLVTSGSGLLASVTINSDYFTNANAYNQIVQPPVPYRYNIALGTGENKRASAQFYWGIQTTRATSVTETNLPDLFDNTFYSLTKYFPNYQLNDLNFSVGDNQGVADKSTGTVLDSDRFNNNVFTLENIKVRTGSDGVAATNQWHSASYVRQGSISSDATNKTRALMVSDLSRFGNKKYAKFTFYLEGGFDGVNIFNKDKDELTNNAAHREMEDSTSQGGTAGSTVAAYRKATDIMGSTSDVEIKLLAIPGMRVAAISDYAVSAIENRFDAMYLMDIQERDALNTVITSSIQDVNVGNTVIAFKNRALNTSFAASYFPDVVVEDPTTLTNVTVPPSVAVLGAFSLNDAIGHPWFAPAGFTRGALSAVKLSTCVFNRNNLDDLYDADINPLTAFPGTGVMVFGQKTLLASQSALDRVNVRRLLINVRRQVRRVANTLLFEPNRQETLDKFNALVNPIMQNIQEQSGVDRYKVIIDTTTTTQADVENNTLRGKIFLQPTRVAEFIALDFVVTNAGANI